MLNVPYETQFELILEKTKIYVYLIGLSAYLIYRNFRCLSRGLYSDFTYKTPGCGLYTGAAYTSMLISKMGRFGNFFDKFSL